ncbi:hypothetical protein J4402_02100 [Candidatus Pacearchaeota archaeon]|nr:hypothetical protein [uncultured archaeon]AQS31853.1 hypothetical protein [uncultured archaeon]MBS3088550.1 hypothetical protein [Candidatus Pacearchaeota archaeon]
MKSLRVLSLVINFAVISFIGLKSLNTACFNSFDINLSLAALILAVVTELVTVSREK